jgi:hypothetical protein
MKRSAKTTKKAMLDAFKENFDPDIEICKELL